MAKAPPGAMSSPWGEGGEMSQMLKNTEYFKDAQFNTETKAKDQPATPPVVDVKTVGQTVAQPSTGRAFDPITKKAIVNLLMDNNIDAVSITDTVITFKYKDGLFNVTTV